VLNRLMIARYGLRLKTSPSRRDASAGATVGRIFSTAARRLT
jgi:hypothetical protein